MLPVRISQVAIVRPRIGSAVAEYLFAGIKKRTEMPTDVENLATVVLGKYDSHFNLFHRYCEVMGGTAPDYFLGFALGTFRNGELVFDDTTDESVRKVILGVSIKPIIREAIEHMESGGCPDYIQVQIDNVV
ncbi:MAG: hypothetical protein Q7S01_06125 [bacterium]|nr:hypothetical protein [bacterium]